MSLRLTPRMAAELAFHEAIVPEAYRDAGGVWTWGIGVTAFSGHDPMVYRDAPAMLEHCLEAYVDLLLQVYAPAVARAFDGFDLPEHQWAAALSFHYNTGAIERASWVDAFCNGAPEAARTGFMDWTKQDVVRRRRTLERDLFFDAVWAGDGTALCFPVRKPDYVPDTSKGHRVDVLGPLSKILNDRAGPQA